MTNLKRHKAAAKVPKMFWQGCKNNNWEKLMVLWTTMFLTAETLCHRHWCSSQLPASFLRHKQLWDYLTTRSRVCSIAAIQSASTRALGAQISRAHRIKNPAAAAAASGIDQQDRLSSSSHICSPQESISWRWSNASVGKSHWECRLNGTEWVGTDVSCSAK